jgi:hypothetical protein
MSNCLSAQEGLGGGGGGGGVVSCGTIAVLNNLQEVRFGDCTSTKPAVEFFAQHAVVPWLYFYFLFKLD